MGTVHLELVPYTEYYVKQPITFFLLCVTAEAISETGQLLSIQQAPTKINKVTTSIGFCKILGEVLQQNKPMKTFLDNGTDTTDKYRTFLEWLSRSGNIRSQLSSLNDED